MRNGRAVAVCFVAAEDFQAADQRRLFDFGRNQRVAIVPEIRNHADSVEGTPRNHSQAC
jgi:hypothetical protein